MAETILVVDDMRTNCQLLQTILERDGHRVSAATSGPEALELAQQTAPDLALLDVDMPGMDGYEVCERLQLQPATRGIPVVFISALAGVVDKVKAFAKGGVDYITKPFDVNEVRARVGTHLKIHRLTRQLERHNSDLESLVREKMQEISASQLAMIFALARLTESRDRETGRHIERIQVFCRLLAEKLAQERAYAAVIDRAFVENIFHASPMHDIGKVAIPDSILTKPGPLSEAEFAVITTHTTRGAETLRDVLARYPNNAMLRMGIDIANYHHERWDGSGYPEGIRGAQIPLAAQIMAVADVYDAVRSKRCYKPAYSHEYARDYIAANTGQHFAPDVGRAFLELAGRIGELRDQMEE